VEGKGKEVEIWDREQEGRLGLGCTLRWPKAIP